MPLLWSAFYPGNNVLWPTFAWLMIYIPFILTTCIWSWSPHSVIGHLWTSQFACVMCAITARKPGLALSSGADCPTWDDQWRHTFNVSARCRLGLMASLVALGFSLSLHYIALRLKKRMVSRNIKQIFLGETFHTGLFVYTSTPLMYGDGWSNYVYVTYTCHLVCK